MLKPIRFFSSSALLAVSLLAGAAFAAEGEGQSDLDKATEIKLTATTITDLGEVIRLAESALKKGLDPSNTEFANRLLVATLVQHAQETTGQIFANASSSAADFRQRRQSAISDLEKALKLDPKQSQAYLLLAQLNMLPGGANVKEVLAAIDKAIEFGGDDPSSQAKAYALRAGLQEQLEKKLADLNEAIRLAPDDAATVRIRGLALADMGKPEQALADLNKAIELEPRSGPTHVAKALVLARLEKYDEALAAINKAIQLGDDDLFSQAKAYALRASLQEQPEKKLADLNEAVRLVPDNAAAVRTRGLTLADMGKSELALADLNKAIELEPRNSPTLEAKAIVLARLKKYDEALATIDQARKVSPKSSGLLVQRARINAQQKKYDAALDDLKLALAIDPNNVAIIVLRAGVHQEMGEKKKALADMDEALKLKPGLPLILRTHALLLAENDRLDEAIVELEKVVKSDPKDSLTLLQLGLLHSAKKHLAKAIETYTAVLVLEPEDWRAIRGRADAYLNIGRQTEAIADYEKAMKLVSKDEGILNNLAWVLATSPNEKLRNGRRAIELATEACKLSDYKLPHILSTLAAAYAEVGDFDNAVKWSTKAIEIGDKDNNDALKKELESYKSKKPTRELITEEKEEKGEKKKP